MIEDRNGIRGFAQFSYRRRLRLTPPAGGYGFGGDDSPQARAWGYPLVPAARAASLPVARAVLVPVARAVLVPVARAVLVPVARAMLVPVARAMLVPVAWACLCRLRGMGLQQ